jgi:hypothetical protein
MHNRDLARPTPKPLDELSRIAPLPESNCVALGRGGQ